MRPSSVNEEKPAGTYQVEFGSNLINQVLTSLIILIIEIKEYCTAIILSL